MLRRLPMLPISPEDSAEIIKKAYKLTNTPADFVLVNEGFNITIGDRRDSGLISDVQQLFDGKKSAKLYSEQLEIHDASPWTLYYRYNPATLAEVTMQSRVLFLLLNGTLALLTGAVIVLLLALERKRLQTLAIVKGIEAIGLNLTRRLSVERNDEIGQIAEHFNSYIQHLQAIILQLVDNVKIMTSSSSSLASVAELISSSSGQMKKRGVTISEAAHTTNDTIMNVAASAEEVSVSVGCISQLIKSISGEMHDASQAISNGQQSLREVTTASSEMTQSIQEIAKSASSTRTAVEKSVAVVDEAKDRVQMLEKDISEIDTIVGLINEIADQTKLLALNATIEAARAGEAGKGFAVVANEVKALAVQTSQATTTIRDRVEKIRSGTIRTVEDIDIIHDGVSTVERMVQTIASTIEEQSVIMQANAQHMHEISAMISLSGTAIDNVHSNTTDIFSQIETISVTTNDLAGKLSIGAHDVESVSHGINEISLGISKLSDFAENITTSSQELTHISQDLDSVAQQFSVK